jgi:uncharacterized protein
MLTPTQEKLLILQDRDQKRLLLESQLKSVPREVAAVEQKISAEKSAIESARSELKELELKKKNLENDIRSAEEKSGRYKTQQMQVRKNDEYKALGHEIEATQAQIGVFEEQELGVMYQIDEAKKKFAAAEAALKQNIAGHEAKIASLKERCRNLDSELEVAMAELEKVRAPVPAPALRLYERLAKTPGLPAIVPVNEGKCGGCHLKISSNIDSESRKNDKLVTCDQCGRIVYSES